MFYVTKHSTDTTRIRLQGAVDNYRFGQIKRIKAREWHAEIREVVTGDLIRYAGIWKTKRDAIEEVQHILTKP